MKILALDSSTEACSDALLSDTPSGNVSVGERFELAPRQHTQRILPLVEALLAEHQTALNQLDAIAFGRGPGSFTGLRICLGAVQGLAFGADLPVVPVSTLAAQVQQLARLQPQWRTGQPVEVISTLDARMDEIYWGVYRYTANAVEPVGDERLTAPEQLLFIDQQRERPVVIIGSGLHYASRVQGLAQTTMHDETIVPTAAAVAELAYRDFQQGLYCRADQALPVYLRDEVAWQKQPPLS